MRRNSGKGSCSVCITVLLAAIVGLGSTLWTTTATAADTELDLVTNESVTHNGAIF